MYLVCNYQFRLISSKHEIKCNLRWCCARSNLQKSFINFCNGIHLFQMQGSEQIEFNSKDVCSDFYLYLWNYLHIPFVIIFQSKFKSNIASYTKWSSEANRHFTCTPLNGTKPLPEQMLTSHLWGSVAISRCVSKILLCLMTLKIILWKLLPHLPWASELITSTGYNGTNLDCNNLSIQ